MTPIRRFLDENGPGLDGGDGYKTYRTQVTTANLEIVRETLPLDQRPDLEPGCITWPIPYGHITLYPESGRAACCRGGDSDWGDYTGEPDSDGFRIRLDDGIELLSDGSESE